MKYFLLFPVRLLTAAVHIIGVILWLVGAILAACPYWWFEHSLCCRYPWVAREAKKVDEQMAMECYH